MQFFNPVRRYGPSGVMIRQAFLRILLFLNLFQFLFKSPAIHLSRYGQTEGEGDPDAQNAQAAWETQGVAQDRKSVV